MGVVDAGMGVVELIPDNIPIIEQLLCDHQTFEMDIQVWVRYNHVNMLKISQTNNGASFIDKPY